MRGLYKDVDAWTVSDYWIFRTFASAVPSGYAADFLRQFHMTAELVALTITLFVIGFSFGPLVWGPLSEQVGSVTEIIFTKLTEVLPVWTQGRPNSVLRVVYGTYTPSSRTTRTHFHAQAFQVGAALSPNTASIMAFRLLGGIFSAAATPIAPYVLRSVSLT